MIVLFTDFGADDIYVGQLKAAALRQGDACGPIVDLLHAAPQFDARAGAHLLAALCGQFDAGTVFLAVVDAGVGSQREAAVLHADEQWFVGPDNGLLSVVEARASLTQTWRIAWQPQKLSTSFHGRDLFAPIAAQIAAGAFPASKLEETRGLAVALGGADLAEIIHIDRYGNAITGLRAQGLDQRRKLACGAHRLPYARVFCAVAEGETFWYENSIGLVEIATNCASAAARLGLRVGAAVSMQD